MQEEVRKVARSFNRPKQVQSLHVLGIIERPDGTKAFIWHEE